MDPFNGKTAVIYSNIPMDAPESHDDHIIPIRHWCREHGVRIFRDFTDNSLFGRRFGLRNCLQFIAEKHVDMLLVDSINVVGDSYGQICGFIETMKVNRIQFVEVCNGDARICDSIADCYPPNTLKSAIDERPFPKGMDVGRSVSDRSDEGGEEDVVDVEPEVERTEGAITFVFNVPKGVREFTIRIREVDE